MSENKNVDTRNATQRIEDLEKIVGALYQGLMETGSKVEQLSSLRNDMGLVRESLRLLNIRSEAIIQSASPESGITPDVVNTLVVKLNVESLSVQVAMHVKNGHLTPSTEVTPTSFLVGEEYNKDGTLSNPRIQFRIDSQEAATVEALNGKKVGDLVSFGDDKLDFKVTEIYSLTNPQAQATPLATDAPSAETPAAETPADETKDVEAPAPEAPAAEAPTEAAPLPPLPAESPVTEFVPHDNSTMATA